MTVSDYKKIDAAFDAGKFSSKVSNIFRRLKTNASDGRLEEMQPYLTERYYNELSAKIKERADTGVLLYTERITILGVDLNGIECKDGFDEATASVRLRQVEYIADVKTRKYLRGENYENFLTATVILKRQSGILTSVQSGMTVQNCPYCGATVNINKSAKCEYCDRILNTDSFYWQIDSVSYSS